MEPRGPLESLLDAVDRVRGAVGLVVLVALTVAYLVLGNLPGRAIGLAGVAVLALILVRWRRSRR